MPGFVAWSYKSRGGTVRPISAILIVGVITFGLSMMSYNILVQVGFVSCPPKSIYALTCLIRNALMRVPFFFPSLDTVAAHHDSAHCKFVAGIWRADMAEVEGAQCAASV